MINITFTAHPSGEINKVYRGKTMEFYPADRYTAKCPLMDADRAYLVHPETGEPVPFHFPDVGRLTITGPITSWQEIGHLADWYVKLNRWLTGYEPLAHGSMIGDTLTLTIAYVPKGTRHVSS